tara:strand:- start:41964 stop:42473 length:510 start_codon:yes stop_codon:yes gene_type:complete
MWFKLKETEFPKQATEILEIKTIIEENSERKFNHDVKKLKEEILKLNKKEYSDFFNSKFKKNDTSINELLSENFNKKLIEETDLTKFVFCLRIKSKELGLKNNGIFYYDDTLSLFKEYEKVECKKKDNVKWSGKINIVKVGMCISETKNVVSKYFEEDLIVELNKCRQQ